MVECSRHSTARSPSVGVTVAVGRRWWTAGTHWDPAWLHLSGPGAGGGDVVAVHWWCEHHGSDGWQDSEGDGRKKQRRAGAAPPGLSALGNPHKQGEGFDQGVQGRETGSCGRWRPRRFEVFDKESTGQPVPGLLAVEAAPGAAEGTASLLGQGGPLAPVQETSFWNLWLPLERGWWWSAHGWAGYQVGGRSAPGRHESGTEGDWLASWVEWGGYCLWRKRTWRRHGLWCPTNLSRAERGLHHRGRARRSPKRGFEFWWGAGDLGLRFLCRDRGTIKSPATGKGACQSVGGGGTKPWMQAAELDEVAGLRHRGGHREADPKRCFADDAQCSWQHRCDRWGRVTVPRTVETISPPAALGRPEVKAVLQVCRGLGMDQRDCIIDGDLVPGNVGKCGRWWWRHHWDEPSSWGQADQGVLQRPVVGEEAAAVLGQCGAGGSPLLHPRAPWALWGGHFWGRAWTAGACTWWRMEVAGSRWRWRSTSAYLHQSHPPTERKATALSGRNCLVRWADDREVEGRSNEIPPIHLQGGVSLPTWEVKGASSGFGERKRAPDGIPHWVHSRDVQEGGQRWARGGPSSRSSGGGVGKQLPRSDGSLPDRSLVVVPSGANWSPDAGGDPERLACVDGGHRD